MLRIPQSKSVKLEQTFKSPEGKINYFQIKYNNVYLKVAVSHDFDGKITWEHVSVMPKNSKRLPTYQEMNFIKMLFWEPEDEVIHFFPKESEHCNLVDNCLHLWRPTGVKLPWED